MFQNNLLGQGSFGKVYTSTLPHGKQIAIKVQPLYMADSLNESAQFLGEPLVEAAIMKRINAEENFLVSLLDVYIQDNELALIMPKYIEFQAIKLPEQQFNESIEQLTHAIAYLHSVDIAHRDIKPQNILYDLDNDQLKLGDFGSSTLLECAHVTLFYRSPELLLGGTQYDKSSDIWSWACTVYELLTNEPLFKGDSRIDQ
jgi:serine/threonine protein kinase